MGGGPRRLENVRLRLRSLNKKAFSSRNSSRTFSVKRAIPAFVFSFLALSFCLPNLFAINKANAAQATLTQASDNSAAVSADMPTEDDFYNGVNLGADGAKNCIPVLKNTKATDVTDAELTMTVPTKADSEEETVVASPSANLQENASSVDTNAKTKSITFKVTKTVAPGEELKGQEVFSSLKGATGFTPESIQELFDQVGGTLKITYTAKDLSIEGLMPLTGDNTNSFMTVFSVAALLATATALAIYILNTKNKGNLHSFSKKTFVTLVSLVVATGALSFVAITNQAYAFEVTQDTETFELHVFTDTREVTFDANGGEYDIAAADKTKVTVPVVYNGEVTEADKPTMKDGVNWNKNYYLVKDWTDQTPKVTFPLASICVNTSLYAGVQKPDDFWIGPAKEYWAGTAFAENTAYVSGKTPDQQTVERTQAQIQKDIDALNHKGTQADYDKALDRYKAYMNGGTFTDDDGTERTVTADTFHLYTRLNIDALPDGTGGDDDIKGLYTNTEDQYMEARIINVGNHDYYTGSAWASDGSVLTFQATKALPEASIMGGTSSTYQNYTCWALSETPGTNQEAELYQRLNGTHANQDFQTLFTTTGTSKNAFWSQIHPVNKVSYRMFDAGGSTALTNPVYNCTSQYMWLLSTAELAASNFWGDTNQQQSYRYEGGQYNDSASPAITGQYAWYVNKIGDFQDGPYALLKTAGTTGPGITRSGATPLTKVSGSSSGADLWERSAYYDYAGLFAYVYSVGAPYRASDADAVCGVLPCFSF